MKGFAKDAQYLLMKMWSTCRVVHVASAANCMHFEGVVDGIKDKVLSNQEWTLRGTS